MKIGWKSFLQIKAVEIIFLIKLDLNIFKNKVCKEINSFVNKIKLKYFCK